MSPEGSPRVPSPSGTPPDRGTTLPAHPDTLCVMSHSVESELVANVLTVHVDTGESVTAGDELVLLESMKMEIPVVAEIAGRVAEVKVTAGDVVQEGEVLLVLDD